MIRNLTFGSARTESWAACGQSLEHRFDSRKKVFKKPAVVRFAQVVVIEAAGETVLTRGSEDEDIEEKIVNHLTQRHRAYLTQQWKNT